MHSEVDVGVGFLDEWSWDPITSLRAKWARGVEGTRGQRDTTSGKVAVARCLKKPWGGATKHDHVGTFGLFILRKALDAKSAPAGWGPDWEEHVRANGLGLVALTVGVKRARMECGRRTAQRQGAIELADNMRLTWADSEGDVG